MSKWNEISKNAAVKDKPIGRPVITKDNIPDKFWKYNRMYQDKQINISEFARMLTCTRPTIDKYIAISEENNTNLK